ncbi:MAG: translation initiation factor IF-2 [Firmicutes bacterium]|nr:translation initiation factor IF-2 [Bacillota bacterium]
MAKLSIEAVAQKINTPVKEVMKKLEEIGIFASSPKNTLSQEEVIKVVTLITGKKPKIRTKSPAGSGAGGSAAGTAPAAAAAPSKADANKDAAEKAEASRESGKATAVSEAAAEIEKKAPAEAVKAEAAESAALAAQSAPAAAERSETEKTGDAPVKDAAKEAAETKAKDAAPVDGQAKAEESKTESAKGNEQAAADASDAGEAAQTKPQAAAGADETKPAASAGSAGTKVVRPAAGQAQGARKLEGEIVRTADGRLVRRIPVQVRRVPGAQSAQTQGTAAGQGQASRGAAAGKDRPADQRGGQRNAAGAQRTDRTQAAAGRGDRNAQGRGGAAQQGARGGAQRPADQQGRDQRRPMNAQRPAQGAARPDGRDARGQGQAARGSVPAMRGMSGGSRRGGSDSYDMGLSAPKAKTENKDSRKQADRKKNDKQRNTANEEYKNKKKSLSQEANYLDDDRLARHKKKPVKRPGTGAAQVEEEDIKIVQLPESMTVKEFADLLHKPINTIIKSLMMRGIMAGLNQIIEYEQAEEIATEMDILVEHQAEEDIFAKYAEFTDSEEDLKPRSPVVVVMGHVDHGKTSLLDAIRDTHVTAREAGGITQHIGASVVSIDGREITFLDTPGHEAFTAMRMRGAQVTDIAILVVAADDGVMPQTIEAINHAKAAGVQIIVAINKMDKYGANPDRVKQELTEYGLVPEDWGGSTICVPVSALKKEGIDTLLEMVLLVADMQELKANPNALASGTVIESELDKGRGAVATVLVKRGTLHVGDTIVAGSAFGRVKAMLDDQGRRVKEAGPSTPVEVTGLSEVPTAGDPFYMTQTDREARSLAEKVAARERIKLMEGNKRVNLNDLFGDIQSGEIKDLNILVKADVQGSVEAVKQSLEKLSDEQVAVKVIHGAVGAINESDVMLASAANAIIIGFNVRPDSGAKSMAEEQKVDIRLYRVIYNAIDDIKAAMKGMLDPEFEEKVLGHAQVRQIFHASGVGTIAGSYVTDGKMMRNAQVRIVRDGIVVYEGTLSSLRRFKDDVREVATGYECGVMFEKFNDVKEGDVVEAFVMEEIKRD